MELRQAAPIAISIAQALAPHCLVVDIAGSVRRALREVGDIEICCLPRMECITTDLFSEKKEYRRIPEFDKYVSSLGRKVKNGDNYIQITLKEHPISLDLFIPRKEDYYRIFAIRTGSADYSQRVIAGGWLKQGWCGVSGAGLRMTRECYKDTSGKWRCPNPTPTLPPAWKDEKEFFDWLKVQWLPPQNRIG